MCDMCDMCDSGLTEFYFLPNISTFPARVQILDAMAQDKNGLPFPRYLITNRDGAFHVKMSSSDSCSDDPKRDQVRECVRSKVYDDI